MSEPNFLAHHGTSNEEAEAGAGHARQRFTVPPAQGGESAAAAAREPAREAPAGADKGDDKQPPSQTPAAQRLPRVSKFPSKAPSQPIDPRLRCPTYYKLTQNPRKTGRTRRRAKHRSFSKQRIYRSAVFA
jgi:hypothetical protein